MLSFRADLHAIEETITRNILIIVMQDVKNLLGMSKHVDIFFDEKDQLPKKKNNLGNIEINNTYKEDFFNVETTESTEDGHELSLLVVRPDFKPIYEDTDIGSNITPIYLTRKLELKIRYFNKSKSKIYGLTNKLRMFTSNDGMYKLHNLEYHYTIPNYILKLLLHINNLKNIRIEDGNKLSLEEYIDSTFDDRVDFSHTLDGDIGKSTLVIREAQVDIEGYITDDIHSITPEYDEEHNGYYIEFSYSFTYEKPVALLVKYPLVVYNTLIDKHFRTFIKPDRETNKAIRSRGRGELQELTKRDDIFNIRDNGYYLRLPEYDNTILPKPNSSVSRMFSVLTIMDDLDHTLLFNIKDIPKIGFKESFLNFILSTEYPYIGTGYESILYIELFKNDKLDYGNPVLMDKDGNLTSTKPLDYKYTYRVMFNIVNNLTRLSTDAKSRFKNYVKKQLESNTKRSYTFQDTINYWNGVNYGKYANTITEDNLITDYLSLLQIDGNIVSNAILGSKSYYDIPFSIGSYGGRYTYRTIELHHTAIMEEKIEVSL